MISDVHPWWVANGRLEASDRPTLGGVGVHGDHATAMEVILSQRKSSVQTFGQNLSSARTGRGRIRFPPDG